MRLQVTSYKVKEVRKMKKYIQTLHILIYLKLIELSLGFAPFNVLAPSFVSRNFVLFDRRNLIRTDQLAAQRDVEDLSVQDKSEIKLFSNPDPYMLIHWRGEDVEGYSINFRHVEFHGALMAETECVASKNKEYNDYSSSMVQFEDALLYTGKELMSSMKRLRYNQAMQYMLPFASSNISASQYVTATQRCSLVHALYEIVASTGVTTKDNNSSNYDRLAESAIINKSFSDYERGQINGNCTWSLRVRKFGKDDAFGKERRYSASARSVTQEQEALVALRPLLEKFGGKVNLDNPDCKIYVFDGLKNGQSILARRIATGPRVSVINPNTRICITNTPLCPIAAFSMCNIAAIRPHQTILDPFAGSCATLLAASMIEPSCRSVAIEIAHDGLVNRDDIRKDFTSRNLTEPLALLQGDCNSMEMRKQARSSIGDHPFDIIITDPPYGIRESKNSMKRPIDELLQAITDDRNAGTPLLRQGGRLVVFIPCRTDEESIDDIMPTNDQMNEAGVQCEVMREQPLNDSLSRWLVSFICTR